MPAILDSGGPVQTLFEEVAPKVDKCDLLVFAWIRNISYRILRLIII
jgi:hypothetical protein